MTTCLNKNENSIKVADEPWRDRGDEARFPKTLTEEEREHLIEYVMGTMELAGLELPYETVKRLAEEAEKLPIVRI